MNITTRLLEAQDINLIVESMHDIGSYGKTISGYERYLDEQIKGERVVIVAFSRPDFVGHVTVIWRPHYPPFAETNIPEISDLSVMPRQPANG